LRSRLPETANAKGVGAEVSLWQKTGLAVWNNICIVVAEMRRAILQFYCFIMHKL